MKTQSSITATNTTAIATTTTTTATTATTTTTTTSSSSSANNNNSKTNSNNNNTNNNKDKDNKRVKRKNNNSNNKENPNEDIEENNGSSISTSTSTSSSSSSSQQYNNNNLGKSTNTGIKNSKEEKMVFDNRIKRKNVLALNEKVAAIREYEKRPIYKRIGRMFHCSPDQIKRIVQQKEAILSAWEQRTRKRDAKTLEMKVVRVSMLGKAVYEWIRRMMYYKDIVITDGLIQKMALQFKSAMGLQNFFPHQDWCDKFRRIYQITEVDSKLLNIGYTNGHSVQIKDVIKDVLSECSPDESKRNDDEADNDGRQIANNEFNTDDDEMDVDVVGAGDTRRNLLSGEKKEQQSIDNNARVAPSNPQAMSLAQLQNLRQLVALPIQTNGIASIGQKVLVATPITTTGSSRNGQNVAPMTMTIIPLATLAQPNNNLTANIGPLTKTQKSEPPQIAVPHPMIEIKKEIKSEPKDDDNDADDDDVVPIDVMHIKKEILSDDEDTNGSNSLNIITNNMLHSRHMESGLDNVQNSGQALNLQQHLVAIPLSNSAMLEESNDSLDDVTLAKLRKRIRCSNLAEMQGKQTGAVVDGYRNKNASISPIAVTSTGLDTAATSPAASSTSNSLTIKSTNSTAMSSMTPMPPMPPLTRAPLAHTMNLQQHHLQIPPTAPPPLHHHHHHHHHINATNKRLRLAEDLNHLQPIKSCIEARAYLKLLEVFAFQRENIRLIGLITRADEVLRELDRKEHGFEDDDDDRLNLTFNGSA